MRKVFTALTLFFALSLTALAQSGMTWLPVAQGLPLYPGTSIVVNDTLYVQSAGNSTSQSNSVVSQFHRLDHADRLDGPYNLDASRWTLLSEFECNGIQFGSYKGELYMWIALRDSLGMPGPMEIMRWKGSTWEPIARTSGVVYSMIEYQNELYVGGRFDSINGAPMNQIARWNGTRWAGVGNGSVTRGPTSPPASIYRFMIYNDELIAGGAFNSIDSVQSMNIARWNGTRWAGIDGGLDREPGPMEVYNGELYVFGPWITRAGNVKLQGLARWNGTRWDGVGTHGTWGNIRDMVVNNGLLYVVGAGELGEGRMLTGAVTWDGSSWTALPLLDTNAAINFVESFRGQIFIGGRFIRFGQRTLSHVARLAIPSSVEQPLPEDAGMGIYPNPTRGMIHLQEEVVRGGMVEVKDLFGRTLLRTTPSDIGVRTIDLSALATGTYFLSIPTGNGVVTRTVSIMR